jgi:hypothetical protein
MNISNIENEMHEHGNPTAPLPTEEPLLTKSASTEQILSFLNSDVLADLYRQSNEIIQTLTKLFLGAEKPLLKFRGAVTYENEDQDLFRSFWNAHLAEHYECTGRLGAYWISNLIDIDIRSNSLINGGYPFDISGSSVGKKTIRTTARELTYYTASTSAWIRNKNFHLDDNIMRALGKGILSKQIYPEQEAAWIQIVTTALGHALLAAKLGKKDYEDMQLLVYNPDGDFYRFFILYADPEYLKRQPQAQKDAQLHRAVFDAALNVFLPLSEQPSIPDKQPPENGCPSEKR